MNEDTITLVFCTKSEADRNDFTTELATVGFTYDFKKVPDTDFWEVSVQVSKKLTNLVVERARKNRLDYLDCVYSVWDPTLERIVGTFRQDSTAMTAFLEFQTLPDYVKHLKLVRATRTHLDVHQPKYSDPNTVIYAIATSRMEDGTIACYGQQILNERDPNEEQLAETSQELKRIKQEVEQMYPAIEVCPGILRLSQPEYLN